MINNTVYVPINDHTVWDPLRIGAQIALALQKHGCVEIHLCQEAPALEHTPLSDFLCWIGTQGFDLGRVTIHTGNARQSVPGAKVEYHPEWQSELKLLQTSAHQFSSEKQIEYHFGCLIGRNSMPRLLISSYLFRHHHEKTWQTFHWTDQSDYHLTHIALEDVIRIFGIHSEEFDRAVHLLKCAPLLKESAVSYPILYPKNYSTVVSWYKNFFVDIVCETWWQGKNFFFTEKFWRCVLSRTPFVFHGAQDSLKNLRTLGFKTFEQWWPESYDHDYLHYNDALSDPAYQNISRVTETIDIVASWNIEQCREIYTDMMPTLEHNYQRLLRLDYQDFLDLWPDSSAR